MKGNYRANMNRQTVYRPAPHARFARFDPTPVQQMYMMNVMNAQDAAKFRDIMSNTPRPTGGFTGCGYMAHPGASQYNGVSCQYNSLSQYHPNLESFHSDWVANVAFPYSPDALMYPTIETPANLPQMFLGGGAGFTPCREDCACSGTNTDCKCKSATCGYPSLQQNCMEPVEGGRFASLSECEQAMELGYTGANPELLGGGAAAQAMRARLGKKGKGKKARK